MLFSTYAEDLFCDFYGHKVSTAWYISKELYTAFLHSLNTPHPVSHIICFGMVELFQAPFGFHTQYYIT